MHTRAEDLGQKLGRDQREVEAGWDEIKQVAGIAMVKGLWLVVTSHDAIKMSLQCAQGFSHIVENVIQSETLRCLDNYGTTTIAGLQLGSCLPVPTAT